MDQKIQREIVATLVKQGRRDLAKRFIQTGSRKTALAAGPYWDVEINKGLESWWQGVFHAIRVAWETDLTFRGMDRGTTYYFRPITGDIGDETFMMNISAVPAARGAKVEISGRMIDGPAAGKSKKLGTLGLHAEPFEVAKLVNDWLLTVFKQQLGR